MTAFRTISSLTLALLALVSSTSFTVGMHICSGEVQNIAVFSKAEGCKQERELPPCHRRATAPCCEDETVINLGNDFKGPIADKALIPPAPVHDLHGHMFISELIPSAPLPDFNNRNYDPPLRSCNITIAYQVFLI